jgi:hypothetical protein
MNVVTALARTKGRHDMLDPQPTFGRFTEPPSEPQPRDEYEWLCEAEDTLRDAYRKTMPRSQKLTLLDRAIECIEQAKSCA